MNAGNSQDGIAFTSIMLAFVATLLIIAYHVYAYTSLSKRFSRANLKVFKNFKYKSLLEQNQKHEIRPDSISRYDDIMDLTDVSTMDADYYSAESEVTQNLQKPTYTSTVVEIN